MDEQDPIPISEKPGHGMKKLGRLMVGFFIGCLIIGRVVVGLFFPESVGKGVTTGMLFVLIPIWTIGIIGVLLLLIGWIRGLIG